MDNITNKIETVYQEDLDLIETVTTKEELIYALWIVKSHGNEKEKQIQKVVAKKQQEIKMQKINDHRAHIILRLIQEAVKKEHNENFLEKLAKEEEINPWDICTILELESEIPSSKDYHLIIEQLKQMVQENMPSYQEQDVKKQELLEDAKITVDAFVKTEYSSEKEFFEKTHCTLKDFLYALNILFIMDIERYNEYYQVSQKRKTILQINDELKRDEIETYSKLESMNEWNNLSREEKISICIRKNETQPGYSYNNTALFSTFCSMYNLKEPLVNYYLEIGGIKSAAVILDADIFQKKELLEQTRQKLKRLVNRTAQEMYGILKLENHNAKNNLSTKVPQFNLYDFTEQAKQPFESFKRGLSAVSEMSNANKIILTYVKKHNAIFEHLNTAKVESITRSGIISCDGYTIKFQHSDATKALKDMKNKSMLNYRGLLFQAIERQIATPESDNNNQTAYIKK